MLKNLNRESQNSENRVSVEDQLKAAIGVMLVSTNWSSNALLCRKVHKPVMIKFLSDLTWTVLCHYFTAEDDLNPRCVALLAKKMAKMHSLDVPIAKDSHQFLMKNYWDLFAAPVFESYKKGHIYEEIQRHKLQTFMEMDLCDEMSWAMEVSVGLGGPVVFTHNDLMRRNILVRNTCHKNADDLDVFIVDYDWSCYMFRGADFADYFIDWCQPELDFGGNDFPTDQQ
ncbi:unnamed protein product, partial [Oppiella nova]